MRVLGFSGLHNSVSFKKKVLPTLQPTHERIVQGLDSAAALIAEGEIVAAAAEERFCGQKGTGAFPVEAISFCLRQGGLDFRSLDRIAHCFRYDQKQFGTKHANAYREVYSRGAQLQQLSKTFPGDWSGKLVRVEHHMAHSSSCFYLSGFEESLILVSDGMGERHSATVAIGSPMGIEVIHQIPAQHSLGIFFGILAMYLGFRFGFDECKVMALAAYGNPQRFSNVFRDFVQCRQDGSYTVPLLAADITDHDRATHDGVLRVLVERLGPARRSHASITQFHMDVAAAAQEALEAAQIHLLRHFRRESGLTRLCIAGGVGLNCRANGVVKRSRLFRKIFVQPAAGDDGAALGAALYVSCADRQSTSLQCGTMPYWGPAYELTDLMSALQGYEQFRVQRTDSVCDLTERTAQLVAKQYLIGWFQGQMEFGPRALGNRSILADPRFPTLRDRINLQVKRRDAFQPFAPAVTTEAAARYFEIDVGDESTFDHMLFATQVRREYQASLAAVTHIDGSARVQVVSSHQNERFWRVLDAFGAIAGMPILLNTSLNGPNMPIACTPADALHLLSVGTVEVLVIGDFIVTPASVSIDGI